MLTPGETISYGGLYLVRVRNFIKSTFINGSTVKWGTHDILYGSVTVKELEDLAADIAIAAIMQDRASKL